MLKLSKAVNEFYRENHGSQDYQYSSQNYQYGRRNYNYRSKLPIWQSQLPIRQSELPIGQSELPIWQSQRPIEQSEMNGQGATGLVASKWDRESIIEIRGGLDHWEIEWRQKPN